MADILNKNDCDVSVGILTEPLYQAGNVPLGNLIEILHRISKELYLVTGNEGYIAFKNDSRVKAYGIISKSGENLAVRLLKHVAIELRLARILLKLSRNVDVWVFFIGGSTLMLPLLLSRLLRKKTILVLPGNQIVARESTHDRLATMARIPFDANCLLCGRLVVYSKNNITEWGLARYTSKIAVAREHFLDFAKFRFVGGVDARENIVGHIGRLTPGKGTFNFVLSIPLVLKEMPESEFFIAGEGELSDNITRFLKSNDLSKKVTFEGWIPHDQIPNTLRNLKLVAVPSYTEGLPNLVLEAMACGTIVLATPVGAIPDLIEDGQTGFLIKDNAPEAIASGIVRALRSQDLVRISEKARTLVEKEFVFERNVEDWSRLIR